MNTQDIRPEELEVETEAVETTDATLQIQTGVQAGFLPSDKELAEYLRLVKNWL